MERFMAKLIAAEKATAGLRHAVVCPDVTGRAKERIAQSKRARAGSLAIVDYSHKWRELVSVFWFANRCHVFFLRYYVVCFVLFRFRIFDFTDEAAALRYACAPTATRSYLTTTTVCVLFFVYVSSFFQRKI